MTGADRYGVVLLDGPDEEPVSLAEAKRHLRLDDDFTTDDVLIAAEISAARLHLENWFTFVTTQWLMTLDRWPCDDEVVLTRPPVQSLDSIEYLDPNGAWRTLVPDRYQVSAGRKPPRVWPAYGFSWPSVRCQPEAIKVTYTAGHEAAADVPANAKQAVLLLVGHLYTFREPVITGTIVNTIPLAIQSLMSRVNHGWRG